MNYIVTNGFSELNNDEIINVEGGRITWADVLDFIIRSTIVVC